MRHSNNQNQNNTICNLVFTNLANLATSNSEWLFYLNLGKIITLKNTKSLILVSGQKILTGKIDAKNQSWKLFPPTLALCVFSGCLVFSFGSGMLWMAFSD